MIPCPMSLGCAVLFCSIGYFLIRRFLGALDPKSVLLGGSSADPWRIPADCRCGSRPMGHSKNVGFYPSICIWAVRERTKAANIPITSPNLSFHGPSFHRFGQILLDFRRFSLMLIDFRCFRRFSMMLLDFHRFSKIFVNYRRFS